MKKENGRLKPADPQETAKLLGKIFVCHSCGIEFTKRGTEFGKTVTCPQCDYPAEEKIV